jgi:glutathione-regulated potassium-efflux system ancillary protein KefG
MMKRFSLMLITILAILGVSAQTNEQPAYTRDAIFIVAHPDLKHSKANAAILEKLTHLNNITDVIDLYNNKKAFKVDYCKEKIGNAGVIVFQFPFYFAQAPSEMKRWIDEVFYELCKDNFFRNRKLMVVATTGAEESTYSKLGRNGYSVEELLLPYRFMAQYLGMEWVKPFVVYGVSGAEADNNVAKGLVDFEKTIMELIFSVPNREKDTPVQTNPRR